MSDKDFNKRDAFSNCVPSAQLLICLWNRTYFCRTSSLPRNITTIAFSKSEEEYSKKLILLKNGKIESVVDYCEESWFKIQDQWVMYFKNKVFNLRETRNRRFESTFNKIKKYLIKIRTFIVVFYRIFYNSKVFMFWTKSLFPNELSKKEQGYFH